MNKELQNLAWSLLPKEFKEEVKRMYRIANSDIDQMIAMIMLENVFGHHNLTSDAEGEEMLTCEKYKVEEALNYCDELDSISGSHNMLNWGKQMIVYLFGSKCLLDAREVNFASKEPIIDDKEKESFTYPKFRVEDIVLFNDNICRIIGTDRENKEYQLERIYDNHLMGWVEEDEISLYEELKPAESKIFSKEHRLNIAAMAMQSLLSNPCDFIIDGKEQDKTPENIAKAAFLCADALIAKSML